MMTPRSPSASGSTRLHVGGDQPHHVEGADQVDLDDALEVGERHRPVAADDALGRPDAGAVDRGCARRRAWRAPRASAAAASSASVTSQAIAMPPICSATLRGAVEVDVEAGDLGAGAGQHGGGRGAEPGGAAGDDRGVSLDVHRSVASVGWWRRRPGSRSAARCPGRRRCRPRRCRSAGPSA